MSSSAAHLALSLALAALVGGAGGCTLVSGWSDLQNGSRSSTDAGSDASPVPTTVLCGAGGQRCSAGQGCCAGIVGGASTCQSGTQGCAPPSLLVTCSDSSACTALAGGRPQQCCATTGSSSFPSVACRTTCNAGDEIVCDPTAPSSDCPPGKACRASADGFGYNTCQ